VKDVMLRNPATVTGATLTAGNLTDGNQAVTLSGSGTFVVPDSTSSSLTVADGVAGGMTMAGWFKVAALPSSTQTILGKAGSYELKLTAAGRLTWTLTGASTVTVTSNTSIQTNRWYMVAGVYNGDYSGTPTFGKTTAGASLISTPGDYRLGVPSGFTNLFVSQQTIQEQAHIYEIVIDMQRYFDSASYYASCAAVVYRIAGGVPTEVLGQSASQNVGGPDGTRRWWTFPIGASVYRGTVGLGMMYGGNPGSNFIVMTTGFDAAGSGTLWAVNSQVTDTGTWTITGSAPDPFGTPSASPFSGGATSTQNMAIYANYTPTARTGNEGQAILYLDGVVDNSASYTRGIADSANPLQHPTSLAVTLDDWMIFDRKLTGEEIAILYASR
jgi:hypothetical protein